MRTKKFVPAEGVEVCVQSFDVDGSVGRVGDGVDAEHCAGDCVHCGCYAFDVCDGAEDVGGVGACYEDCVFGEEWRECVWC